MLIELSITNYKSISEKQTFSMSASKLTDLKDNVFTLMEPNVIELLKTAAMYGANASGKSNFLEAMHTICEIVVESASGYKESDPLPISQYKLDEELLSSPSEFEVTFISDSVRYQFGFSATKERIISEWLFSFPYGRARTLYQREWDNETYNYKTYFGQELKGDKSVWTRSTRSNALLLSTAVLLNSEQLLPVYRWFERKVKFSSSKGWGVAFTAESCLNGKKERILKALRNADTGIDNIEVKKRKFDLNDLPSDMPKELKSFLSKEAEGSEAIEVMTYRKNKKGDLVKFDLSEESDGTTRLFGFLGPWIDSLNAGNILFIDELHNSLHPKMVEYLVKLFNNPSTNPNNAQLIFTTHETSILKQNVFRRDQIWFSEKLNNETSIYPLTDFVVRKGSEDLEASYLAGKFGALPFIGDDDV
ncbi:TPA: ATP/GTP-binding protein [Proteus mirabilis]|uniref:AAA family ATPase n=1 Tax=Proteus mirabilis TaxID=584 RepID=UPI0023F9A145|nr:ATP-binding protein [Proteus mirabilis]MDF7390355.1 ATP-binding protein [Proteus mirabilis]MDF7451648.1 ATP-binding protein [Proteus mirabilis]HEK2791359.1 ATP-binding protein [Proteus mirabilis]HEK3216503.1 ATP-binding protein [Proteus mirabilis]